ncbi:MAG: hypothetical protein OHK0046_36930 [Anaerolineae bacterium]
MLLFWDKHGRKDLPWRQIDDPWLILLTEVMLRKTTSEQVSRIFNTMSKWRPDDILDMKIDELTQHLKPLGLSSVRAAQLKLIAAGFADVDITLYRSDEYLRSFPGIGRYIANSVRCCAFDEPVPALDTNMIRIIQRVFGWASKRARPREDKALWDFAETLVPQERPMAYNWGVLDFGAAVCTHRNPKCLMCPLNSICNFFQEKLHQNSTSPWVEEADID